MNKDNETEYDRTVLAEINSTIKAIQSTSFETMQTQKAESWIFEWVKILNRKKEEGLTLDECKTYFCNIEFENKETPPQFVYAMTLLENIYYKL